MGDMSHLLLPIGHFKVLSSQMLIGILQGTGILRSMQEGITLKDRSETPGA